jgi:hypothetical protein
MNLLEQIPERGYGEIVGDINIYKWEAFIETDVSHNSSCRLEAYLPQYVQKIFRYIWEIILNEFIPLRWRCRQFVSSEYR